MKKLLSMVLSLAILGTSAVFAAPIAVETESAEEQVITEIPVQDVQADTLLASVEENVRALEFGIVQYHDDLSGVTSKETDSYNQGGATITKNEDGSVTFDRTATSGNSYFYGTKSVTFYAGRIYTYYVDFSEDTNINLFWPTIIRTAVSAQISNGNIVAVDSDSANQKFTAGLPYKRFKRAAGSANWWRDYLGFGSFSTTGATANVKGLYLYYKPETELTAPTPVYDNNANTVTITYESGLHSDVLASLNVQGAIKGVVKVTTSEDNKTVTYKLAPNKKVTIPSLVNSDATGTYPAQEVEISVPSKNSVLYGIKVFDEDFSAFDGAQNGVLDVVIDSTGTWDANQSYVIADSVTFKKGNDYTLYADITTVDGNNGYYAAMFSNKDGSSSHFLSNSGSAQIGHQSFSFGKDARSIREFSWTSSDTTYTNLRIGATKADTYTVDNIGLYYKPTAQASELLVSATDTTLSITYPDGIYNETVLALEKYPETVGATNASYNADTKVLTLTADSSEDIVVPALVNAAANATYKEVNYLSMVNAALFGVEVFEEDFSEYDGGVFTYDIATGWSGEVEFSNASHTLTSGKNYTLYSSVADDNGSKVYLANSPTHLLNTSMIESETPAMQLGVSQKKFTLKKDEYTFTSWKFGATASGTYGVNSIGLYYKPQNVVSVNVSVSGTDTLVISYPDGVYERALEAIVAIPSIVGADSASFENNVLTLTASDLSTVYVPALVNAGLDATYASINGKSVSENTETGIRTDAQVNGMGLRAVAKTHQGLRADCGDAGVEYGFLITRKPLLEAQQLSENDLTFELENVGFAHGVCFGEGVNKLHDINGEYDFYSVAFMGIPTVREYYNEYLVFRSYVKYTVDGVTVYTYGEPVVTSVVETAYAVAYSLENNTDEESVAIYNKMSAIIDFAEGNADTPFIQ